DLGDRLTLLLGASYANGPNASGGLEGARAHRTQIWGADFTLRLRDAASRAHTALQAEWMTRRAEVPGGGFLQGGAYVWLVRRFDARWEAAIRGDIDRKSTRLNSSHVKISYAVFCLKKKKHSSQSRRPLVSASRSGVQP